MFSCTRLSCEWPVKFVAARRRNQHARRVRYPEGSRLRRPARSGAGVCTEAQEGGELTSGRTRRCGPKVKCKAREKIGESPRYPSLRFSGELGFVGQPWPDLRIRRKTAGASEGSQRPENAKDRGGKGLPFPHRGRPRWAKDCLGATDCERKDARVPETGDGSPVTGPGREGRNGRGEGPQGRGRSPAVSRGSRRRRARWIGSPCPRKSRSKSVCG